jgi:hypothetical protein
MTLAISFGPWGGFYRHWGYTKRICLGWVAITYLPVDLDAVIEPWEELHEILNHSKDAQ